MSIPGNQRPSIQMYLNHQDQFARLEELLITFITHSSQRQDETDIVLRNHQASISRIEKQVAHMAQLLEERAPENSQDFEVSSPRAQINVITNKKENFLSKTTSKVPPYQPPIPYPERLNGSDECAYYFDEFDSILQEELEAFEETKTGYEDLLLKEAFEELDKLLGLSPQITNEEPNITTHDEDREDQPEIDTLLIEQKEETFGIDKDMSDEKAPYLDELEDIVEKEMEEMVEELPKDEPPKEVPPKPPDCPFMPKPQNNHSKRTRFCKNGNIANMEWKRLKNGEVRTKKRKSQVKGCYEHKRDKWKERIDDYGARGKREKGVKASPDATDPT